MAVGLHSMHNSSHASEFSSRLHLSVASRLTSRVSEYLPASSFHHEHAHSFFATNHKSCTSFRSARAPTFFGTQP